MKTVLVHRPGGPEALDYTDAPMPAPGEREVLIRARAFGVGQPDKLIRSGVYKWMPPLPANPGNDVAGEIEAIGSHVTGISVGQRVLLSARHAAGSAAQRAGPVSDTTLEISAGSALIEDAAVWGWSRWTRYRRAD